MKTLIVIVGPTAVGKTSVSINVAKAFDCPIVSADSRQFYREMEIGTAKPSKEELSEVKHYFINTHSIHEEYNAGQFEMDALKTIDTIFQEKDYCVLTGGSGLFIDAVCEGFDEMPKVPEKIRNELNDRFEKEGLEPLLSELKNCDPIYIETVDTKNPRRVIRALEIYKASGKPFSSFRTKKHKERSFNIIKIGLNKDRETLYRDIDLRMDIMIQAGLFEEAQNLFEHRYSKPLQTVGYSEIFGYLSNEYDKEEAIRLLKRNSRRYAKRQLTWFNKTKNLTWFSPDEVDIIIRFIKDNS